MELDNYDKWNRNAPLGLILTSLGLSLIGQATFRKSQGKGWRLYGALALITFNMGIAIFGEAVKARTLYEIEIDRKMRRHA